MCDPCRCAMDVCRNQHSSHLRTHDLMHPAHTHDSHAHACTVIAFSKMSSSRSHFTLQRCACCLCKQHPVSSFPFAHATASFRL